MKNKKFIIIIIAAAVLLLIGGILFFAVLPGSQSDQNKTAAEIGDQNKTVSEKVRKPENIITPENATDTISIEMTNSTPEPEPEVPADTETPVEPDTQQATPSPTPIPPNPKEHLIRSKRHPKIVPEDFSIGALQDRADQSYVKRILYNQINYFLYFLTQNTVDTDRISPDWKTTLERTLNYYLEKGYKPYKYRIGAITLTNGNLKAHAGIRLYGDPGIAQGEIYLEVDGQYWYISDIQIDFSELSRPYEIPEEPFEPETFKFLLEG